MDRLVADVEVPARGVSIPVARERADAPYAVPAHYVPLVAYVGKRYA